MGVVCCQVEVSAMGRSPGQRAIPIVVPLNVIEERHIGGPGPLWLPSQEKRNSGHYLSVNVP